jgi:hypothetical protein
VGDNAVVLVAARSRVARLLAPIGLPKGEMFRITGGLVARRAMEKGIP